MTTARVMKVGVQLPEVERVVRWPELRLMAQLAEQVGFDSLWLGDHLLYRYPDGTSRGPWEAWSTLAALAAVTSRVELGPLVASTSFHNPAMLAKKAATIDEISGGRLILGLGAGWNETEYKAFGFPYDRRVERFAEAFTIIRTLLAERRIDFAGRYYEARDCELIPAGPRAGGPPLMIGSTGPRMLRLALPYVSYWNAWYSSFGNDVSRLPALLRAVDEACREVGRAPADVERTVALLVALPDAVGRPTVYDDGSAVPPLRGTPDELADQLRAFARAGISHVQLVLDPITAQSIERLAPVLELLDQD
ncbi:MAG TPA: LLM class flavin-dependent oxidoreductase [Candidatus Limnocylindria bacterium]|nr:LLM class flavin-dependent oxidoreductase [Candidatus Limnocylindria bacterium]